MKSEKISRLFTIVFSTLLLVLAFTSQANIIGEEGTSFNLTASEGYISVADGGSIYSWGYSTNGTMQLPGPTLILTEGDEITISLTNSLPVAAGNVSIVFPGHKVTSTTGGVAGALTQEASTGNSVSYTFIASKPGTYQYHSGTRSELQVEMGLYGAIIVRPNTPAAGCAPLLSAYNHSGTCYDREYLYLLSEIDIDTHRAAEAQAGGAGPINIGTGQFTSEYWMINGRAAPDTMASAGAAILPHQPYNAMTRMHPGERLLMRVVGVGREFHPFHFHGNHARVLARDGNLLVSESDPTQLAGPLLFTIPSVPGSTTDAIFEWTGKDLGWDVYSSSTNVAITNAGFEVPVLNELASLINNIPGWTKTGDGRIFNPSNAANAPEGANMYRMINDGIIEQTLNDVLALGSYNLNVEVGERIGANSFGNYSVELGVNIAGIFTPLTGAIENSLTPNNGYLTSSISYSVAIGDPIGEQIAIRLTGNAAGAGVEVLFDDVRLDYLAHSCVPDTDGFHNDPTAINYREWCADHGKPIPVELPALSSLAFGGFYSGSPYLGVVGSLPPGEGGLNPGAGFSYMWHSHTEREMVNNDIFPGGMMTMLIIEDYNVDITEFGGDKP